MTVMKRWLVVDPSKDEIKVVSREPSLARGQAAFPLEIRIPDSQRRIFTDKPILLTMPGWSPPEVFVGNGEAIEEADLNRISEQS